MSISSSTPTYVCPRPKIQRGFTENYVIDFWSTEMGMRSLLQTSGRWTSDMFDKKANSLQLHAKFLMLNVQCEFL